MAPVRSVRLLLLPVAALGLLLRGLALWATPGYRPHHDDRSYLLNALALVRTHAYPVFWAGHVRVPTAYRAPGFPLFLALVHALLGHGLLGERLAQMLVGAAIVVLVGVVGRQLWGPRTGLAAAALAAASPVLVLFDVTLISEPLFAALLLGALSCALAARRRAATPAAGAPADGRTLGWAIAAGALVGLAALTRPEGLALAFAVALCAGTRRSAVAVLAAAVLCIAPWTIRNAVTLHAFVPISTETGNTLAGTYNSVSLHDGRWRDPRRFGLYPAARAANRDSEAGTDHALTRAVLAFVVAHPASPARVAFANATRLAGAAPTSFSRLSLSSVSLPAGPAPLLRAGLLVSTLLGLAGAATVAARRAPTGWWAAAGLVALVGLLVNAEQRFAVPLQPFLALLGALVFTGGT